VKVISVIGKDGEIPENLEDAAYIVGSIIAEKGFVLACGGHTGVMEAACRGAKDNGGLTVGIMPEDSTEGANPYVDIILPTAMGYARNTLVALAGEVVIAVGGSTGTLSEIAQALNFGRQVVVVTGVDGIGEKIPSVFNVDGRKVKLHMASAEEAVEVAVKLIEEK